MNQQDVSGWVESQFVSQVGQLQEKEILLVLLLLDDSGSIETAGNTQAVIDGGNGFLQGLKTATGEIRVKIMFLNSMRDTSFGHLSEVPALSRQNYLPNGQTPLFIQSYRALKDILDEARDLESQGFTVRTMTFIFTDGADNQSGVFVTTHVMHVKAIVDAALAASNHIVGGCAVNDGHTNFWEVFTAMGIPAQWIKVLKSDPTEVEETMSGLGAMASMASTNRRSFEETSIRGFTETDKGKK